MTDAAPPTADAPSAPEPAPAPPPAPAVLRCPRCGNWPTRDGHKPTAEAAAAACGAPCHRCGTTMPARALPPSETGAVSRFFRGIVYAFRGIGFALTRPALWPWLLIPLVLTPMVVGILLVLLMWVTGQASDWLTEWMTGGWEDGWGREGMEWGVTALLWVGVFFVLWVALLEIAKICCLPSSEMISRYVDAYWLGELRDVESVERGLVGAGVAAGTEVSRELIVAVLHAVMILPLKIIIIVFLLPLWFIPLVGGFIWYAIPESVFFSWDYLDLPTGRRGYAFHEKISFLERHRAETLGFGLVVAVIALVPIINVFLFPAAAAGGTLLYLETGRK